VDDVLADVVDVPVDCSEYDLAEALGFFSPDMMRSGRKNSFFSNLSPTWAMAVRTSSRILRGSSPDSTLFLTSSTASFSFKPTIRSTRFSDKKTPPSGDFCLILFVVGLN